MDSFFGIGLPEFLLILVIAGMVMGPERIVRMARSLGVLTARLQNISRSFLRQLSSELDSVDDTGALRNTAEELKQLRQQVADLRDEVFTLTAGESVARKKTPSTSGRGTSNSIMPPTVSSPASSAQNTSENKGTAIRPPALAPVSNTDTARASEAETRRAIHPPQLPRRVDVPEDPDA